MARKPLPSFDQRASQLEAHQGHSVVYVPTHVFEFPINTIIAWIINDYHEQGNIIITNLLLPLGHISNKISEKTQMFSMNNLIINPQFIGSQQTHRENYIEQISKEIIVLNIKVTSASFSTTYDLEFIKYYKLSSTQLPLFNNNNRNVE